MPTVVIAPDSFKGTISASNATAAIAQGWGSVRPGDTLVLRPMADGGEGTVDAFATATQGATLISNRVTGPDGRGVDAEWLLLPDGTAVIELATASGLQLLDPLLPLDAHTFGFGELIAAALDAGASRLVLGVGGSASTDGGAGMLTALGARFLDGVGTPIPLGNGGLAMLESVDLGGLRAPPPGSLTLTDVESALLGAAGAAFVFGPQKGASVDDTVVMDANLERLVTVLGAESLAETPGAGAAGGTGFASLVWGARVAPGARTVGELVGLPAAIAGADLVITGEGRFDSQTATGKVARYVAGIAGGMASPVGLALVAGTIEAEHDRFAEAVSLADLAGSTDAAMSDARRWLVAAGEVMARKFSERWGTDR